jgi:cytochrome c peroxidase
MRFITAITTAFLFATTASYGSQATAQDSDIKPIPQTIVVNDKKAALGEKLYNDKRLSADNTISCASCHDLKKGGTDRLATSTGIKGQKGPINSPTVYNSASNFVQFWDGRARNLQEQALGPVENPLEMGEKWPAVIEKIKADKEYAKAFTEIYGGKITKENTADAIAEFERTLTTPGSRFDEFLSGKKGALTETEKKGYTLFNDKGCTSCHSGTYLGGNSYQTMNPDYFKDRGGKITDADMGRFNVTKKEEDRHMFKVPMLRNIAETAPYFHDGSVKTLEQAVKLMSKYQLGAELSNDEAKAIAAFLKTLTGKYKDALKP